MRILFFLSVLLFTLAACSNNSDPKSKSWVFDQENVLTYDQEKLLNEIITNFEKETTNEIAIVTTSDIGEHNKMVFYAVDFGNRYGVGKQEKDNGLVIVFSKTLRGTFISTGLSTEKILTDVICQNIVDNHMVPEFKKGNYFTGIKKGLEECILTWKENE